MTGRMSRRRFLESVGAGALVVGWSPSTRGWVTAARAAGGGCPSFDGLPSLDGVLLQDEISRMLASEDYGHIVRHQPCAVLRPGSVGDVVKVVRFAARRGIWVSMRGQGHSSYGQAQVEGGVVIDSASLGRIHSIESDRATVEPGVLWRTLLMAAATHHLTPPVNTDFQDLSVGGTLSLGGLDSGPMPHGAQVDNVLGLEVVTGKGELLACSPSVNSDLFNAVLGGLGQCGIIVRATLRLIPMPAAALLVRLHYDDLGANLEDLSTIMRAGRFNAFEEQVSWQVDHWAYDFEGAVFYNPPASPNKAALLAGLHDNAAMRTVTPIPYLAWHSRLDPLIVASKIVTTADRAVVFNGLVPEARGNRFLRDLFGSLTQNDLGQAGRVFILAANHAHVSRPLLQLPSGISFAVLLAKFPIGDSQTRSFLDANRVLYDRLVGAGGKRYPWDAIPDFNRRDWITHFGSSWALLESAKRRFDPNNILGSGVGVFG